MKMLISRTSDFLGEKKPCNKAKKETQIFTNLNGSYDREPVDEKWSIEINTLAELLKLHNEVGSLILRKSGYKEILEKIEIYDIYRE